MAIAAGATIVISPIPAPSMKRLASIQSAGNNDPMADPMNTAPTAISPVILQPKALQDEAGRKRQDEAGDGEYRHQHSCTAQAQIEGLN